MHSQFIDEQVIEVHEVLLNPESHLVQTEDTSSATASNVEPMCFQSHFEGCMEMYADAETVVKYLDNHRDWFCRSALPMKVEPLGDNGYALCVGRFGAFGYEVEPKVGLELLPHEDRVYRTRTIPIPGYTAPGYEVDYNSVMELVEVPAEELAQMQVPALTRVEWTLELAVYIQFPKFIHKLSKSLIQKTGDRVLDQIVRQVSRRLTPKVQADFHTTLGITVPKKYKKF